MDEIQEGGQNNLEMLDVIYGGLQSLIFTFLLEIPIFCAVKIDCKVLKIFQASFQALLKFKKSFKKPSLRPKNSYNLTEY